MGRIEEAACADAELEAAPAQLVERCRGFREHGRRPEGEFVDVGKDSHRLRLSQDPPEQRQGVEVARLVGVVLHARGISDSMLSDRLSSLASAGLVTRTVGEGPPLSVVYDLTEHGRALLPALHQLSRWAEEHLPSA